MIFSENRYTLFRIMLQGQGDKTVVTRPGRRRRAPLPLSAARADGARYLPAAAERLGLPRSFSSTGENSERDFFGSARPVSCRAICWKISEARWLFASSAIICPLLAAVPNTFESNGIAATGGLSMVLAKLLTSISGRLCMPTWLMQ